MMNLIKNGNKNINKDLTRKKSNIFNFNGVKTLCLKIRYRYPTHILL